MSKAPWSRPSMAMTMMTFGHTSGTFSRPSARASLCCRMHSSGTMQRWVAISRMSPTSARPLCVGMKRLRRSSLWVEREKTATGAATKPSESCRSGVGRSQQGSQRALRPRPFDHLRQLDNTRAHSFKITRERRRRFASTECYASRRQCRTSITAKGWLCT